MNIKARMYWCLMCCAFLTLPLPAVAKEMPYPIRPLRLIVPFAPGGSADVPARLLANALTNQMGQQIVVDNRSGAGGIIAAETVAKAQADGYTILLGSIGMLTIIPNLKKSLSYNPDIDFLPVSMLSATPTIIVVHPKLGVQSVRELISLANSKPGAISFGSSGTGSSTHLSGELFKSMAKVDLAHVPYKGAALAVLDLVSGQILLGFDTLASLAHVRSGRLKALAISTSNRSVLLPDVPTVAESGVPGYETSSWNGVMLPASTSKEIANRLYMEIVKAIAIPDVRDRMQANGNTPRSSTPLEFKKFIGEERMRWGKLIKEANIQVE